MQNRSIEKKEGKRDDEAFELRSRSQELDELDECLSDFGTGNRFLE